MHFSNKILYNSCGNDTYEYTEKSKQKKKMFAHARRRTRSAAVLVEIRVYAGEKN